MTRAAGATDVSATYPLQDHVVMRSASTKEGASLRMGTSNEIEVGLLVLLQQRLEALVVAEWVVANQVSQR